MVNALCLVLVEVPLCIWMRVIYTFLQGPQWVWTWPAGGTEDIVCWRRMHHILYLLFWIQWGDKRKPIFYYHMAAVFLTTAYRGLSDRDRKSWVVRSCYLYARPLSVTLSERRLTPSAPPAQPGAHFSAQGASIPQNGVGWGCFQLGHSPCLTGPWFNGTSNHVSNYRRASSPTSLWFRSWTWPFPPNSHCGPAEDLRAAMVRGPMQSQPTAMLSLFEHSSDPLAVSTEGILWSVMSPTATTPPRRAWSHGTVMLWWWKPGDAVPEGSDSKKGRRVSLLACGMFARKFLLDSVSSLDSGNGGWFLGWVPQSQWLGYWLGGWMSTGVVFPIYLCERRLPFPAGFLSGSGSRRGLLPSCASPAGSFQMDMKHSLEPLAGDGCPVRFKRDKESVPDEGPASAHCTHHSPLAGVGGGKKWWLLLWEERPAQWVWKDFMSQYVGCCWRREHWGETSREGCSSFQLRVDISYWHSPLVELLVIPT